MIATIGAEDDFDINDRLGEISAPTLVVGGGRDRFYPPELFGATAHGGTFADRRFGKDVVAFLRAEHPARR